MGLQLWSRSRKNLHWLTEWSFTYWMASLLLSVMDLISLRSAVGSGQRCLVLPKKLRRLIYKKISSEKLMLNLWFFSKIVRNWAPDLYTYILHSILHVVIGSVLSFLFSCGPSALNPDPIRAKPVPPVRWPPCRFLTAYFVEIGSLHRFPNFYTLRVQILSIHVYVWLVLTMKRFVEIGLHVFLPKIRNTNTWTDRGGNFIYIEDGGQFRSVFVQKQQSIMGCAFVQFPQVTNLCDVVADHRLPCE